jgi:hypothetical protein
MNMSKHTPGPWTYAAKVKEFLLDFPSNGPVSARVNGPHKGQVAASTGRGQEECEANARLIAAAPELLAMCEAMLPYVEAGSPWDVSDDRTLAQIQKAARAAIAKATGGGE